MSVVECQLSKRQQLLFEMSIFFAPVLTQKRRTCDGSPCVVGCQAGALIRCHSLVLNVFLDYWVKLASRKNVSYIRKTDSLITVKSKVAKFWSEGVSP
jgi:hypothetical protein